MDWTVATSWRYKCFSGRAHAGGVAGGGGAGPLHFLKKIKLRNTHFLIKGISDGIRILDWRTSPKHPNLWLVRFGKLQNDYLYKTTLTRRLLRFQQPGDVVYAQTMESFFIKVLKSPRSYDFLKQIELDDIVDNMKKFQELPQQSTINKFVPICKLLLENPATIAGEKGLFRQLEG